MTFLFGVTLIFYNAKKTWFFYNIDILNWWHFFRGYPFEKPFVSKKPWRCRFLVFGSFSRRFHNSHKRNEIKLPLKYDKNVVYFQKFRIPTPYNLHEYITLYCINYYNLLYWISCNARAFLKRREVRKLKPQSEYSNTVVQPCVFMYTLEHNF